MIELLEGFNGNTPLYNQTSFGTSNSRGNIYLVSASEDTLVCITEFSAEIRDKEGELIVTARTNDFMPHETGENAANDPTMAFNPITERFLVSSIRLLGSSLVGISFAQSLSADPQTLTDADWDFFTEDLPNSDFVLTGYNADGFIVSNNLVGNPVLTVAPDNTVTLYDSSDIPFVSGLKVPAHMPDSEPGDPAWLCQYVLTSSSNVSIIKINDPFGTLTATLHVVNVDERLPITEGHTQPSGAITAVFDNGGSPPIVRNVDGQILMAFAGVCGTADGYCRIAWYIFDLTTGTPVLLDEGRIAPESEDETATVWNPSVSMDANGTLGIAYIETAADTYPTIKVTGRKLTDPAGTVRIPQTVKAGAASWNMSFFSARAIKYVTMALDPSNDSFWSMHVYADNDTDSTTFPFQNWSIWLQNWWFVPLASTTSIAQPINVLLKFDVENRRYEVPFTQSPEIQAGEEIIEAQVDVMRVIRAGEIQDEEIDITDIEWEDGTVYFRVGSDTITGTRYVFRFTILTEMDNKIVEYGEIVVE